MERSLLFKATAKINPTEYEEDLGPLEIFTFPHASAEL